MADITPILESVADNADGTYTAFFGYTSTYTTDQIISVSDGSNNFFSASPADRGQPTTFSPGTNNNAFSVVWDGTALDWTLEGVTVSADASQSVLSLESDKVITVNSVYSYLCPKTTGMVWVKDPVVSTGDTLVLMAVSDPYGNILNTDSSIKLEILRTGEDYRLVYFNSRSRLIDKNISIKIDDGEWHLLVYECLGNGVMRYSVDGINIESDIGSDNNGLLYSIAQSSYPRPGGGLFWTPYLYKSDQAVKMYQLRFGSGFNLGLSWIKQIMNKDKQFLDKR